MDTAIHVGNIVDKETSTNLSEVIKTIFEVGYATKMEQSTIIEAIRMVATITEVKQVNISNSSFSGDKIVNMDKEEAK